MSSIANVTIIFAGDSNTPDEGAEDTTTTVIERHLPPNNAASGVDTTMKERQACQNEKIKRQVDFFQDSNTVIAINRLVMWLPPLYDNDLEDLDNLDFLGEPDSSNQERWDHVWINWDLHVEKLLHEKHFSTEYRMSFKAFCDLCLILFPLLEQRHEKSRSQERITVTIIVACGLQFLAGGKASDQKHIFGMSRVEVYRDICCFLKAVNEAPEVSIVLPVTPEEWGHICSGFARKSYNELFHGCVGAMDGFPQPTIAPTWRESFGNVLAYYLGHYESYGLNCQSACDADLKFTFFAVVGPGNLNDNAAFPWCVDLYKTVMDLLPGLYFWGDAADNLCETLLVPFTGSQRVDQRVVSVSNAKGVDFADESM